MDWKQIRIFLAGFACILVLTMMTICSVCAFHEGNTLTIVSGIVNLSVGIYAMFRAMKMLEKK